MTEHGMTFPAFEGSKPGKGSSGHGRGRSWWAKAWVRAVEDAALDLDQLRKGRRFARTGRVGAITVAPGLIHAPVEDELETHSSKVRVSPLSDTQWEEFLTEIGQQAGHLAALLDRDMPRDLIDSADRAGVPLLPEMGDVEPECTCPAWEFPCLHAAALCYQASWLLDADPFLLLLLRGRSEGDLVAQLTERQARQRSAVAESSPVDHGPLTVDGRLPEPLRLPDRPGEPPSLDAGQTDPSPKQLERAVGDAAVLAWKILQGVAG